MWPFTAGINTKLRMCHLRMDDYQVAAEYFSKAAGVMPIGPFASLAALSKQMKKMPENRAYNIVGPNYSVIDSIVTDSLPVIEVRVNNGESVKFLFDTGGIDIVLDENYASELKLEVVSKIYGSYAAGKKAMSGLGVIDSLDFGDMQVESIPFLSVNMTKPLTSIFSMSDIKGAIGARFLMHFLSSIDYKNSRLVLRRIDVGERSDFSNLTKNVLFSTPIWLADTHYILTKGSLLDEKPGLMWVDTGLAGKGVSVNKECLIDAGIEIDTSTNRNTSAAGGVISEFDVEFKSVGIGSGSNQFIKKNVPGIVFEDDTPVLEEVLGLDIQGILSHDFFEVTP